MSGRLYCGARGTLQLGQAARLGRRFALQPKMDGCYATITTDRAGRIGAIVLRSGELAPVEARASLAGVRWAPDSVIVGELEVWTEASARAASARGHRVAHLFDAIRVGGVDVSRRPYGERRDALLRADSALVADDHDRPWLVDGQGDAHDPASGRYTRPTPAGWRRFPVVPQVPATSAAAAWSTWVDGGLAEGLVVVALDAPLAARGAKRRIKPATTIDGVVVELGPRHARVEWGGRLFVVGARCAAAASVRVGDLVEVACQGFTDGGTPKHPRITRPRPDLAGCGASR